MYKIMFVCHGNICRSPMAEFIMKKLAAKSSLNGKLAITSAATSTEEIGNGIYPPAKAELKRRNIHFTEHFAVQVKRDDYDKYDLFVVMDTNNVKNIMRIFGNDADNKVHKLLECVNRSGDVADPWYSDRFDIAFNDIYDGCVGLLNHLDCTLNN